MKGSIQDFSENEGTESFHILGQEVNKEFFEWVGSERRGGPPRQIHRKESMKDSASGSEVKGFF